MNLRDKINLQDLVKQIRTLQLRCTDDERLELWWDIREGYCKACGKPDPKANCCCSRDE